MPDERASDGSSDDSNDDSADDLSGQGQGLGKALKVDLDRLGITQDDIAAMFGKRQQSVSKWIAADRVPQRYWAQLAERLGPKSLFVAQLKSHLTGGVLGHTIGEPPGPVYSTRKTFGAAQSIGELLPSHLRKFFGHPVDRSPRIDPLVDYVSDRLVLETKHLDTKADAKRLEYVASHAVNALQRARYRLQEPHAMERYYVLAIVATPLLGDFNFHRAGQHIAGMCSDLGIDLVVVRSLEEVAAIIGSIEEGPARRQVPVS